jgi:hypothetical protein
MFGRLRNFFHGWVRAKDSAATGPTIEELRSVRNTADYLAEAIKASPDGQLGPDDLEKLKGLGANLGSLTDKLKE